MSEAIWICEKCHKSKAKEEVEASGWQWPECCGELMQIGVVIGQLAETPTALSAVSEYRKEQGK